MKKVILVLLLISATASAQQQPWSAPPRTTPPPVVPTAPNGVIMTPQGNITRNGNFVQYPNGSTAIINNGLTTWSDGSGCRTTGNSTYCW